MNNCCIPLWISINQENDDPVEEKYLKLREKLWYVKEEEKCRRRTGKTIQQFHPNWYPKEWYVFIACGPPAGAQRLGVFRPKYMISCDLPISSTYSLRSFRDIAEESVYLEDSRDDASTPARIAHSIANAHAPAVASLMESRPPKVNLEAMLQNAQAELEYIANLQAYSAHTERLEKRLKYVKNEETKEAILEELISHLDTELPRKRTATGSAVPVPREAPANTAANENEDD